MVGGTFVAIALDTLLTFMFMLAFRCPVTKTSRQRILGIEMLDRQTDRWVDRQTDRQTDG